MKNSTVLFRLSALLALVSMPGCQLIGDIFKAGAVFGILIVVAIIGLIMFIVSKMGKK